MSSKNLVLTPLPENNTKKFDGIKISNKDFTEYCIYKRPFLVNSQSVVKTCTIDRTRSFTYDENGVLIPIKDSATIGKLETSINDSRNRAKANLFGYALNNEWEYFITLTFDPKKVNRLNDGDVIAAWTLFRKRLQYYIKDIKILLVPEYHKNGGLHFHGFFGNTFGKLANFLKNSGHKNEFGDTIYNLSDNIYNLGHTTAVIIKSGVENQLRVTFYLGKYFTKNNNSVRYNKKSYYRTYNLNFSNKTFFNVNDYDLLSDINEKFLVKENDKMFVYRVFK